MRLACHREGRRHFSLDARVDALRARISSITFLFAAAAAWRAAAVPGCRRQVHMPCAPPAPRLHPPAPISSQILLAALARAVRRAPARQPGRKAAVVAAGRARRRRRSGHRDRPRPPAPHSPLYAFCSSCTLTCRHRLSLGPQTAKLSAGTLLDPLHGRQQRAGGRLACGWHATGRAAAISHWTLVSTRFALEYHR